MVWNFKLSMEGKNIHQMQPHDVCSWYIWPLSTARFGNLVSKLPIMTALNTALLQIGNEAKTGRQNAETAEFVPSFPGRQNVTRQSWHLLGRALLAAILESPGKDGDPKGVITDILRSYWVPRKKIGINGCGKLS